MTILNNGDSTYVHTNGTTSCIDIACCTNDLAGMLEFEVLSDSHGSDHIPMLLSLTKLLTNTIQARPKWKLEKADWPIYQAIVKFGRIPRVEDQMEHISKEILRAAEVAIPKTCGGRHSKIKMPWWSNEVAEAIRNRRKALRDLKSLSKKHKNKNELAKIFKEKRSTAR
jgi:hypothetical protein